MSAISAVSRVLRSMARDKLPPMERDDSCSAGEDAGAGGGDRGQQPGEQSRKKYQAERERREQSIQMNGVGAGKIVPVVRKPAGGQERKQNTERSSGRCR